MRGQLSRTVLRGLVGSNAHPATRLFGWEVRCYLREKFQHRCGNSGRAQTIFELDHIQPRSRGGSNRVSNLALSCHACNAAKGDRTASEFGHPEVEAQGRQPLRDAEPDYRRRRVSAGNPEGL